MIVLYEAPGHNNNRPGQTAEAAFYELLDAKAWDVLGLTGEEFKRRWYAGGVPPRTRGGPAVKALDAFMRTGQWQLRASYSKLRSVPTGEQHEHGGDGQAMVPVPS